MSSGMTTTQKVQQCSNVKDALLVLAQAIDELAAKPADPFAEALEWGDTADLETPNDSRARFDGNDIIVDPVSPVRQADRAQLAAQNRFYEFVPHLNSSEFEDAYVKGGPRWLYYTYRDAVMSMPISYRQALVEDVLLDSPSEADEIGRDILKYEESQPEGAQLEALRRDYGPLT